jgi:F-box-like
MITYLCVLAANSPLVTIGALPDEILLNIFDFCRVAVVNKRDVWPGLWPKMWHNLVHVCQRWRYIVFSSPVRLNLRLYCNTYTSAREMLDAWPPFPIEINCHGVGDKMMAAFEHCDRICGFQVLLHGAYSNSKLASVMQKPFPSLTSLQLWSNFDDVSVVPDTILGGSAPHLRSLSLAGLPFPTLPRFLLSCNDLSELQLLGISDIGYISPEAMVKGLSALTRLALLRIDFDEESETIQVRGPPPLTRALLPALTELRFRGVNEYLENLLARIDAPQLKIITIKLFGNHADIRQVVSHFVTLGPFDRAKVRFSLYIDSESVDIELYQSEGTDLTPPKTVRLGFLEDAPDRQVSSMAQFSTQSLSLLSNVTELDIRSDPSFEELGYSDEDLIDNPWWLVLFRTFTAVRTLHLSGVILPLVVYLLRGHTRESVPVVLPELQNIYLCESYCRDKFDKNSIMVLIVTRQRSGHPVAVHMVPYDNDCD